MSVVASYEREDTFVSRHFRHQGDGQGGAGSDTNGSGGDCPGESEIHYKMKAIAYARLENEYPDSTLAFETGLDGRIPDVLLEFPEPRMPHGKGIAVEAQYRNEGKDKEAAVEHYLSRSYSVAWLEEDDFTTHDVDLSGILTAWPHALPRHAGLEGYPDITRWLWQEKQPSVELDIPIPAEYWTSLDKSGEWVTVVERPIKRKGSARISRSPTGELTFSLGKAKWGGGEALGVQVYRSDVVTLKRFADALDRVAFGKERPSPAECDSEWHELCKGWFTGAPQITAWITAALPDPSLGDRADVVVTLWKKRGDNTERVSMQARPYAAENLREVAELLEVAFDIEEGETKWDSFLSDGGR